MSLGNLRPQRLRLSNRAGEEARGSGLKEQECKLTDAANARSKKAEGLLAQMRASWREAKKRHLLKSSLPKMPASTLPPFGKLYVTGEGAEQLHSLVAAVHAWGVEILDQAGINASKSVGAELRAGVFVWGCTPAPRTAI